MFGTAGSLRAYGKMGAGELAPQADDRIQHASSALDTRASNT